jgi:uncharacterized protein YgbK (DUF1537 family)
MTTDKLLLTFYGDDFTGSTDSMEALTLGGVRTALFLEPPEPEQLTGRFANLQALGVAGVSRSMTPTQMEEELRPKFTRLKKLGAPLTHYKVCSTFDSSPTVGSIGRALDIGWDVFEPPFVPLMVGAPVLNRYVTFANLFATVGPETYRIDRHPTMSKHPITPMDEGDLRLHLARQTDKSIALLDLLHLVGPDEVVDRHFQALLDAKPNIVLFDTIGDDHLLRIGRLIWQQTGPKPLFIVGSSGVEYALTAYWQSIGMVPKPEPLAPPGPVDQLIVMTGSAAPVTAGQISWAVENDFTGIRLDTARLIDPDQGDREREATVEKALAELGRGRSVVLYAARGPDDPAIAATNRRMVELSLDRSSIGHRLGKQQGRIVRALLEKSSLRRACVAGGDTSGHAALQLGIYALEVVTPIAPGAPLCRASSDQPEFDGLEISLKGGQNGQPDYFGQIRAGKS